MRKIFLCVGFLFLVSFIFAETKDVGIQKLSDPPFSYGTYIIQKNYTIPYSHCIFSPKGIFYIYQNNKLPVTVEEYSFMVFIYDNQTIIKIGDCQYICQMNKDKIILLPLFETKTGKISLKFLSFNVTL